MRIAAAVAAVFVVASLVGVAAADDARPPMFVPEPGHQEFSGQMIARPVQPSAWARRGVADGGDRVQAARDAMAAYRVVEHRRHTDVYIFEVPEGGDENAVAAALMGTGNFQYVHPDWIVYPIGSCTTDPRLSQQWHHAQDRMDSCRGWTINTGDPNIVIGICDTGIDVNHEDLLLHRRQGYNAVDRIWENAGGDISDIHGHGTETTGCAAANGDNNVGVAGTGWNLGHRMLRVSNSAGGGSQISILTHAAEVAAEAGDRVSSVSYTGVANEAILTSATYIKSLGGLLFWAADNSNRNHTFSHRDEDDVIVVGGTDINDIKSSFSSYGIYIDFAAPATDVYTTKRNNQYGINSGTSFATPLAAGLAGLIWSIDPGLHPDEVERILKEGCDDIGDPRLGYGRTNVYKTLQLVPSALTFEYPAGIPDLARPGEQASFEVVVAPRDQDPKPGSGLLHYDDGAGPVAVPMTELEPNRYEALLPALRCGQELNFYVSAETMGGERIFDPSNAPDRTNRLDVGWLAGSTPLDVNFMAGIPAGWSATGLWHVTDRCGPAQPCGGNTQWAYFGQSGRCDYHTTRQVTGDLTAPAVQLPPLPPDGFIRLTYCSNRETETNQQFDLSQVRVNGVVADEAEQSQVWQVREVDLAEFADQNVEISFHFDSKDGIENAYRGWQVDNIRLDIMARECVDCYADCDGDGQLDFFDFLCFQNRFLAADPYADCDENGTLDFFDFLCFQNEFLAGCP